MRAVPQPTISIEDNSKTRSDDTTKEFKTMPANRLEFQENGLSIWITIPPKIGSEGDADSAMEDTSVPKVVSLDNLYSAAADRKQEKGKDLSNSKLPFLWKLYEMLEDAEYSKQDDIVSWVNDGKAFKVHQLQAFVETIVPKYSKLSKYKSFQRQLYFYGFIRIQSGKFKGAYHHPKFVRGKKTLCLSMTPKNNSRSKQQRSNSLVVQQQQQENAKRNEAAHLALQRRESAPAAMTGNIATTTSSQIAAAAAVARQIALERSQSVPIVPPPTRNPLPINNPSCFVEACNEDLDFFNGMPFHCL